MGVVLRWVPPDPDSDWDQVRIYRDTSEDGAFSSIHVTLPISQDHYFDLTGSSGFWYKISFYDSVNDGESVLSDAIQGGDFQGYCTPQDVYDFTDIKERKVDQFTMSKYIELAAGQLNRDISVDIINEEIKQINDVKLNTIDGSNTVFYTRCYPIGDKDNDSEVSVNDLEVYQVEGDGTRTRLTVSSITPNTGRFVLAAAPDPTSTNISRLELEYVSVPVSVSDPHPLVRLACIKLAAAFAYSKLNIGKAKSVKFGTMRFMRHVESFDLLFQQYESLVYRINHKMADTINGEDTLLFEASKDFGPQGGY